MKKSKFTEEQIAYALRQVEGGSPPADVCRQLGVSEATFYIWKKKYAHLGVSELRQLRSLEDENARLKRLVADLSLDKHILTEALRKKSEAHTAPRAGRLGPHDLRRQRRAGLSLGAVQSGGVVSAVHAGRPGAAAGAHSGARPRPPAVWLHAHLGAAPSGGMAGEYEAGATAVSARRTAAADARASTEAHRVASRAGADPG
jgi:putative transposase